ncbi:MAG: His-Xaa-Ser system radical SAM maturase HxsB, partial [Elusimicrobia bacterium]|nr:His-Xaa-Ser system radical SAM maturase HxsB [Elusimicrobiota bacterium]
ITNDQGRYLQLEEKDFSDFIGGRVQSESPLYAQLKENGFLGEWLDFDQLAQGWKKRNAFLSQGTGLHIVVVTLRCNQKCVYCQVSSTGMKDTQTDMTLETADRVVDRIFQTPNRDLTIEFQGGEPLVNWPVVQFIVQKSKRLARKSKKNLMLGLVSNLSMMDDEKLDFLLKNGVTFCTSLDGPAEVHEKNRLWLGGTSHGETARWWETILQRTRRKRYRIDGLTTITRHSLKYPREIVDEYVRLGARGIYLRHLSPLGFALKTWESIGYTPEEFLSFYRIAMDYILELNLRNKKVRFFENMSKQFLTKILLNEEPNNLDVRSPCGAGIGQVAYNFDGSVYTCDEGRMLSRMGDESFRIGDVRSGSHVESMRHPVVRTLITASTLEGQPQCSTCAYKPYDGVCPIYNYVTQGDIVGRMHSNLRCRVHMGVLDYLFERIREDRVREVFERWVAKTGRPIRSDIFRRS